MGNTKKENSNKSEYLIEFKYNGKPYCRHIFSDNHLEVASMTVRINHAVTNAESLLRLEEKLVPEGKFSHIRLYDKNGNLLANED